MPWSQVWFNHLCLGRHTTPHLISLQGHGRGLPHDGLHQQGVIARPDIHHSVAKRRVVVVGGGRWGWRRRRRRRIINGRVGLLAVRVLIEGHEPHSEK
jgi:hypothetical protein